MQREYWWRVHKRAFADTAHSLGLESREQIVIRAIIAAVIIVALAWFGSPDSAHDELIVRAAILIAIVLLVLPVVYAWKLAGTPARLEEEARLQSAALQTEIGRHEEQLANTLLISATVDTEAFSTSLKAWELLIKNTSPIPVFLDDFNASVGFSKGKTDHNNICGGKVLTSKEHTKYTLTLRNDLPIRRGKTFCLLIEVWIQYGLVDKESSRLLLQTMVVSAKPGQLSDCANISYKDTAITKS